jgi:hypothetical protein
MEDQLDSLMRRHNHSVALAYGIIKHSDFMTTGISNVLKKTIKYVAKSKNPLVMKPFYEGAHEWAGSNDELWLGLLAESVARHDETSTKFYELALCHFWRALSNYIDHGIPHTHSLCVAASLGVVRCGRYFDGMGCEVRSLVFPPPPPPSSSAYPMCLGLFLASLPLWLTPFALHR